MIQSNSTNKHIFTCRCPEPEGDIYRSVYPIYLSLDDVKKIWDKSRQFKTLLNKELKNDFHAFLSIFYTEVNGQFINLLMIHCSGVLTIM
jgi:hypothetical protein